MTPENPEMTQPAKRSFSTNEADAMEVDSGTVFSDSGVGIVELVQRCFGSKEAFVASSVDEKAHALALLGSVDFSLDVLERELLTSALAPQIFACLDDPVSPLAVEAAVCLKNLMTNENAGLGNKCTRRLYALCLFPVLARLMDKIIAVSGEVGGTAVSPVLVEAIGVQVMCIASVTPAALPQITNSPLVRLFAARQAVVADEAADVLANCALLQALLVAVEDNKAMAEQIVSQCPTLSQLNPARTTPLLSVLSTLCLLQCARLTTPAAVSIDVPAIAGFLLDQLGRPLPDAAVIQNEPQSVKSAFEVYELATEAFELLLSVALGQAGKFLRGGCKTAATGGQELFTLPLAFSGFWKAHFAAHFEGETNADRVRLARRLWSIVANLFTLGEQLMLHCRLVPPASGFQEQLMTVLQIGLAAPEGDFSVADELSGWIRARLTVWGDQDYPPGFSSDFFTAFKRLFLASSSPVVLTNACAMVALLIPYAPEPVQAEFCVFLNGALGTEPFDADHLEVLLSAVDAVTGIFDPESKEWPAKPLAELKADVLSATQRLSAALSLADDDLKAAAMDRISTLKSFARIF